MPDSHAKIRTMTDSEFDEWTNVRSRGKGYFRRKCFLINSIVAGIFIATLAAVEHTSLASDWIRLMLPDVLIPCFFGLPFLITFVFAPLLWQTHEDQYAETLRSRAAAEPNELPES